MTDGADDKGPSRRIDKWLWCARRFKTRSLAAKFVSSASVRVTRDGVTQRVEKPGFLLHEGDEVSFMRGERVEALVVTGFAERRGTPATSRLISRDASGAGICENSAADPACKVAG
jgi:ribosomal 50S subunit-recycling heat shock protein